MATIFLLCAGSMLVGFALCWLFGAPGGDFQFGNFMTLKVKGHSLQVNIIDGDKITEEEFNHRAKNLVDTLRVAWKAELENRRSEENG
jgi:hypothetical protein